MRAVSACAVVLLLAACGGSAQRQAASVASPAARTPTAPRRPAPLPVPTAFRHSVTVRTESGLRYSATLTRRRGRQCLLQIFALAGPGRPPYEHIARSCGRANRLARPVLIEAEGPPTALILDGPAAACGRVLVRSGSGPAARATSACSAGRPTVRVTVMPSARVVTVHGIAGVTKLTLLPVDCATVCARVL